MLGAVVMELSGCHPDMWVQKKVHKPLQETPFFPDGSSSRPRIAHTVQHGNPKLDKHLYTGIEGGTKVNWSIPGGSPVETGIFRGKYYDTFPFPITRADLERGQQRFNVYCSPCHGVLGNGDGMIARRGFNLRRKPANFHDERLVKIAIGHFFDVMTNGYGIMYSYAERVDVMDRWRIAAYIRALQLSESQTLQDVPESERQKLTAGGM